MTRKLLIPLLIAAALVPAACGGDSESPSDQADVDEITALVEEVNRATRDKDAQAFCAAMQPSGVTETFNTASRCVSETEAILEQTGSQPPLEIEDVEVDGDRATVDFVDKTSDQTFVKEGGKWYVPLGSGDGGVEVESGE